MTSETLQKGRVPVLVWSTLGFTLMFATGALLFWALAAKCYGNVYFRIKVLAMCAAALNAAQIGRAHV